MSDPDLNLLIALDALIAEASVAGAARRLGLSASAMSRTLTRLRNLTGDQLLVRAGRQMVLTPCAEALRERATNIVQEARSMLRPSAAQPQLATLRRTFTIRANDGFVEAFGPALIAAVTSVAPFIRLSFAPKNTISPSPLREGSADLEIGIVNDMGPEVRVQALFRDRFVGVARSGHALEKVGRISPEYYASCRHVATSPRGRSGAPVDAALEAIGLTRNIVAIVPSFPGALAIARSSDLVALVPASYLQPAHEQPKSGRNGAIYVFELPVTTAPLIISQMWHPRLERDPAHRWLRERVRAVCESYDG